MINCLHFVNICQTYIRSISSDTIYLFKSFQALLTSELILTTVSLRKQSMFKEAIKPPRITIIKM